MKFKIGQIVIPTKKGNNFNSNYIGSRLRVVKAEYEDIEFYKLELLNGKPIPSPWVNDNNKLICPLSETKLGRILYK